MWDLPGLGIEPVSLALADGLLTTGPLGKSSSIIFSPTYSVSSRSVTLIMCKVMPSMMPYTSLRFCLFLFLIFLPVVPSILKLIDCFFYQFKTARSFRYDLNQIPYDYTVEVRNRLKGLDLIDRVPDEQWNEVRDIVQDTGIKTMPMEKKCKKAKWLSREALQIAVKRRDMKSKGEKERYKHLNAEFQRIARRDKKAFFSDQCKEIEENNRMGKTRHLFMKIRVPSEHFMQRWAQ